MRSSLWPYILRRAYLFILLQLRDKFRTGKFPYYLFLCGRIISLQLFRTFLCRDFSCPLCSGHLSKKNLKAGSSVGKKTSVLDYILMFALTLWPLWNYFFVSTHRCIIISFNILLCIMIVFFHTVRHKISQELFFFLLPSCLLCCSLLLFFSLVGHAS